MPALIAGFDDMHGMSASEFSNLLKSRGTPTQNQHGQWGYETMVFDGNHLAGFMPGTSNPIVVDTYRPEFVALGNSQTNGGCPDCPGGSNDPAFGSSLSDWVDVTAAELLIFGTGFDLSSWEKPKNMHWDVFRAGQRTAKSISRKLSFVGASISLYQAIDNPTGGNVVDATFSIIGTIPHPVTTGIGGLFFGADLLTIGTTGKGISDNIDSYIWMPNPAEIGFVPLTKIPGK